MEGIPLKPLMSVEDRILRRFMADKSKAKVLATISNVMASLGNGGSDLEAKVTEYMDITLNTGNIRDKYENRENKMFEEYEQIKDLRPELKMNKDGESLTLTTFGAQE